MDTSFACAETISLRQLYHGLGGVSIITVSTEIVASTDTKTNVSKEPVDRVTKKPVNSMLTGFFQRER
jgi:hypothetical protein